MGKIVNGIKTVFKSLVDIPTWMDWKTLRNSGSLIKHLFKRTFVPQQPTYHETFEESLTRLNLSEDHIQQRAQEFKRLFFIYLIFSLAVLGYGIYHLIQRNWLPVLVSISMLCFTLVMCFRFHFWLHQIKRRKLGCTFREWLVEMFGSSSKEGQ